MNTSRFEDDPRIAWQTCEDESRWIARSVATIAEALADVLALEARARLLLSGGSTPGPVYRALADEPIDWSRIDVGLVDERDVGPDDAASNARLVRETLVEKTGVRFHPLREGGTSLEAAVARANVSPHIDPSRAVCVLGMGDDGHTASLFPGAADLDAALVSPFAYASLDATGCVGAGKFVRRLTLTRSGLASTSARILLLRGANKRRVFERAPGMGDARELPIRSAIESIAKPLHVLWCRE